VGQNMPFRTKSATNQKREFTNEWLVDELPFSSLCHKYGISRPTGYKWIARYQSEGAEGLEERSHATKEHANALDLKIEALILRVRGKHPTWGPKKLIAWIKQHEGLERVCATSTAHALLGRHGLLCPRKLHRHPPASGQALGGYEGANAVWCVDYKGWFRMGNEKRCDPLTITDGFSRYLLRCQGFECIDVPNTRRVMEAAFREYGLPERIRSDNGTPFGSVAIGGLSTLSVWWMKLGIVPERIAPGRPDQNGRHERMHLTLKEATEPPGYDLRAQQRNFDRFRRCFNTERPHEALGQKTPSSAYEASPRKYVGWVPEAEYDSGIITRKISKNGELHWKNRAVFLTETLHGETVALEPVGDGLLSIRFCKMVLGTLHEKEMRIVPKDQPKRRRKPKPA
jgi:putative transposase